MKKSIVGLALAAAFTSQVAFAAPVPTWQYSTYANWVLVNSGDEEAPVYGSGANQSSTSSLLTWGTSTGSGQSSLKVEPNTNPAANTGSVTTNGGTSESAAFDLIHTNNPITGGTLQTAQLKVFVDIKLPGAEASEPAIYAGFLLFNVKFLETPNSWIGSQCSWNTGAGFCDDIFVVTNASASGTFQYDNGDGFGPRDYFVNYLSTAFDGGLISEAACKAVLGDSWKGTCTGFTTDESGTSERRGLAIAISTPVPEPGSLALLGLGLLGLGALRRRKAA